MSEDIAWDLRSKIIEELQKDDLVFTGQLRDSWRVTQDENGNYYVGSTLLYAKVMNDGRLPGKAPPINALFPWVATKLGGSDIKQIRQKAFAVAQSIAKNGIEGRHYIQRAMFRMESESR